MESLGKIERQHHPLLYLSLPRPSFSKPLLPSSLFPKTPLCKTSSSSFSSIPKTSLRASCHSHLPPKPLQKPFHFLKSHNPSRRIPSSPKQPQHPSSSLNPISALLKSISLSIAAVAFLLARFPAKPSLAVATAPAPTPTVESVPSDANSASETEREKILENYLNSHPDDIKALRSLMESRIKLRKLPQAIETIDRLIAIQPTEKEWPLLRAHLNLYGGDVDVARSAFEDLIAADPFRVEAYHGLAMAVVQSEPDELDALMKRIGDVMELCKKEKKKEVLRDFKLLLAQVRVIEGKYDEALNLYGELVKEEPGDFRPYLCQGIIYTLLGKKDEAEKQFDKYKRLVPKGHPYAQFFDENVLATKVFSQMADKDKPDSKR